MIMPPVTKNRLLMCYLPARCLKIQIKTGPTRRMVLACETDCLDERKCCRTFIFWKITQQWPVGLKGWKPSFGNGAYDPQAVYLPNVRVSNVRLGVLTVVVSISYFANLISAPRNLISKSSLHPMATFVTFTRNFTVS